MKKARTIVVKVTEKSWRKLEQSSKSNWEKLKKTRTIVVKVTEKSWSQDREKSETDSGNVEERTNRKWQSKKVGKDVEN